MYRQLNYLEAFHYKILPVTTLVATAGTKKQEVERAATQLC